MEVFLVIIAAFGIYYYVKSRSKQNEDSEWVERIQAKQADAEARIELWEKEGGEPGAGVWQAVARMHVMVVVAPKFFKPVIAPAPPETRARLERIYKQLGVSELAQDEVPEHIWDGGNSAFAKSYNLAFFEVGELASTKGWRR